MLPVIEAVVVRRRNLQHHRPDVLRVEERHEVDRVGVGRERLVLPGQRPRPVDDLVEVAARPVDHRLEHELVVDRRHAPDDGLDGAAVQGAFRELIDAGLLSESLRCKASHRQSASQGGDEEAEWAIGCRHCHVPSAPFGFISSISLS